MTDKDRDKYNAYMREYMLVRYHKRRQEAIILLGGVCVDCGSVEDLQFDHIIAKDKTIDISKVWSCSSKRFNEEVSKCVLRCDSCHKIKSRKFDWKIVDHGGGMSGKNRCQCAPCRKQKTEYMRKYMRTYNRKRKPR